MLNIVARNVNGMFSEALWRTHLEGEEATSRNGLVLTVPCPVVLEYLAPTERVLFEAKRDANPFFHLFESLWMLAGHNDVAFPATFAKQMEAYTDDGRTLHGAYGYRWRNHFGLDQLGSVINELRMHPDSRRAVLAMWDSQVDQPAVAGGGKDIPCNTHVYFALRSNVTLDMTVCNRSNDLVWGACGANAVHMSMLHEYVARSLGVEVGTYFQFTNNLHIYDKHFDLLELGLRSGEVIDYYTQGKVKPFPLFTDPGERTAFDMDCHYWCNNQERTLRSDYFRKVVDPMYRAWKAHKEGQTDKAMEEVQRCGAADWSLAGFEWLVRRIKPDASAN